MTCVERVRGISGDDLGFQEVRCHMLLLID